MDEWIKKLKTDRTVTMEDGSDADKYMVITGLNGCIDRLIAHIERLEAEREQIIQIIKQQRWHFSDVEWENLLSKIQALQAAKETP